jgi:O-antigen ligase
MFCLAAALGFSVLIIIVRDHSDWLPRIFAALALTVGLAGLAGLAVTSSSVQPSILNSIRADRDTGDVTELTGRVELWRTCLGFAAEHPLLGFGFDGFWSAKHIEMISEELHWSINHAHSAYLDQLLALGVPGASLYILLLLGCFFTCAARFLRGQDRYGAWAALLLFIAIHNATESINVLPTFPNFAFNLIVLHLALFKPRAFEGRTSLASPRVPSLRVPTSAGGNELVMR